TVTLYELRPDELPVLEYACNTRDMIDTLRQSWEADGRPMTARGSTGQLVIHPLIGEIRVQQLTYEKLRSALKLPELDGGAETNQNRDAANASWQPGVRGRGA
ncbi:MAG TPA: hypothetical protein VFH56_15015, partial [Acidimicrobiales bacterium]|nr:hypothetical protein [Acidimicrobiales bacterium]